MILKSKTMRRAPIFPGGEVEYRKTRALAAGMF